MKHNSSSPPAGGKPEAVRRAVAARAARPRAGQTATREERGGYMPAMAWLGPATGEPSRPLRGMPGLGVSAGLVRRAGARLRYTARALKGQVLVVGTGGGHVNPLDLGPLAPLLARPPARERSIAPTDPRGRRLDVVAEPTTGQDDPPMKGTL